MTAAVLIVVTRGRREPRTATLEGKGRLRPSLRRTLLRKSSAAMKSTKAIVSMTAMRSTGSTRKEVGLILGPSSTLYEQSECFFSKSIVVPAEKMNCIFHRSEYKRQKGMWHDKLLAERGIVPSTNSAFLLIVQLAVSKQLFFSPQPETCFFISCSVLRQGRSNRPKDPQSASKRQATYPLRAHQ
jgi:hypothetical protein